MPSASRLYSYAARSHISVLGSYIVRSSSTAFPFLLILGATIGHLILFTLYLTIQSTFDRSPVQQYEGPLRIIDTSVLYRSMCPHHLTPKIMQVFWCHLLDIVGLLIPLELPFLAASPKPSFPHNPLKFTILGRKSIILQQPIGINSQLSTFRGC